LVSSILVTVGGGESVGMQGLGLAGRGRGQVGAHQCPQHGFVVGLVGERLLGQGGRPSFSVAPR
jgi:hypothetical protein